MSPLCLVRNSTFIASLFFVCVSCTQKGSSSQAPVSSGELVTFGEVMAEAPRYAGKTITVAGEIQQIYGPRAFSIGGEGWQGGELRVLSQNEVPRLTIREDGLFEQGDLVLLRGEVKLLSRGEIEAQLGALNLKGLQDQNNPVLMASTVKLTPRTGLPTTESATPLTSAPPSTQNETIYDPRTLVSATDAERPHLVGRSVEMDKVTVQTVVPNQGIWVGPTPHEQVFVRTLPGATTPAFKVGDSVSIQGTVKKLPDAQALQKDWGLDPTTSKLLDRDGVYIAPDHIESAANPPATST